MVPGACSLRVLSLGLALRFEYSKCHMSSLGTSVPLLKVVQTIAGEADCSGIEALEAYDILKNSGVKVSLYVLLLVCADSTLDAHEGGARFGYSSICEATDTVPMQAGCQEMLAPCVCKKRILCR